MTAFLQRLVARAGVGGDGEPPPVPAGGVRPRVAGRFEPAAAGPPPDEVHEAHEPVRRPPGPLPVPPRPESGAVHRGVLVAPTGAVPPPPAPRGGVQELAPGGRPTPVDEARSGDGPEKGFARRLPEPVAPAPAIGPAVPPPVAAGAIVDRPPPPSPAPVPPPAERARDRRDAGEPSRPRVRPAPVPALPARPAAPASGAQPRSRAVGPDRSTAGEPVVHVTIGRVEIRTAPPRPDRAGPPRTSAEPSAVTALEEYLAGRAGGR